jgi:hypothetical protein
MMCSMDIPDMVSLYSPFQINIATAVFPNLLFKGYLCRKSLFLNI